MPKGWIRMPAPNSQGAKFTGWLKEMNEAYKDEKNIYAVMARTIDTEYGQIKHAAIRNIESTDISWSEKQRIKNELFGEEVQAIEFFPKQSDLVDEANMYHLWIFLDTGLS